MTSPHNDCEPQGHQHAHSHSHGPAAPVSGHLRKVIAAVLIPFAAAVVVGLVALWPGGAPAHERTGVGFDRQTQQGKVVNVGKVDCKDVSASQIPVSGETSPRTGEPATGDRLCEKATVEVTSGQDKGRTFIEVVQPDAPRQLRKGQGWSSRTPPTRPTTSSTP